MTDLQLAGLYPRRHIRQDIAPELHALREKFRLRAQKPAFSGYRLGRGSKWAAKFHYLVAALLTVTAGLSQRPARLIPGHRPAAA